MTSGDYGANSILSKSVHLEDHLNPTAHLQIHHGGHQHSGHCFILCITFSGTRSRPHSVSPPLGACTCTSGGRGSMSLWDLVLLQQPFKLDVPEPSPPYMWRQMEVPRQEVPRTQEETDRLHVLHPARDGRPPREQCWRGLGADHSECAPHFG